EACVIRHRVIGIGEDVGQKKSEIIARCFSTASRKPGNTCEFGRLPPHSSGFGYDRSPVHAFLKGARCTQLQRFSAEWARGEGLPGTGVEPCATAPRLVVPQRQEVHPWQA